MVGMREGKGRKMHKFSDWTSQYDMLHFSQPTTSINTSKIEISELTKTEMSSA